MKHSSTKSLRVWFTDLQRHLFRDWSATKTERKRRALRQALTRAENDLCQARARVVAIPRQTETIQALLEEFLSYEATQKIFEEHGKASILTQIQEKRDTLSQLTRSESYIDKEAGVKMLQASSSTSQLLQSLNLLERAVKLLDELTSANLTNAQTLQADPTLTAEIESSKQLLQRVQAVRDDFINNQENPSILCDDLNHLQLLLNQIRYEVNAAYRLSTLQRFSPKIEQISQVAKSVTSEQVGIVYLVSSTSLEIERWLCRYQWNLASLPTGWFLGYFVNRFRDITRLLSRVSGIRGAHYSNKNTVKGKIIAGLIVSLFIWLSIFFGVSLLMLIGKFVVQSIGASNTRRISVAKTEINAFQDNILKSFDASVSALPLAQLSTLPANNKTSLKLSYEKTASITNLLSSLNLPLTRCNVTPDFTGFQAGSSLVECRTEVAEALQKVENSNPATASQEPLLKVLNLELLSLEDQQQIDNKLLTFSTTVQGTNPADLPAYGTQLKTTRDQIIAEIDRLKRSETILVLIDFFNSLNAEEREALDNQLNAFRTVQSDRTQPNIDTNLGKKLSDFYQTAKSYDTDSQLTSTSNVFFQWSTDATYTQHIYRFLLALLAGGIGGVVSIFTRIDDIEKQNPNSPFLLGLLQPLIGATFSIVAMLVLSTPAVDVIKILPRELYLQPDATTPNAIVQPKELNSREVYLILVVGFIVGFSERFAKNAFNSISRNP